MYEKGSFERIYQEISVSLGFLLTLDLFITFNVNWFVALCPQNYIFKFKST